MVPAILILTFAWSLKAMTDSLGAKQYVEMLVKGSAGGFKTFLPAIVFLIACFLSFSTGTSWGTFGILIPITLGVFPLTDRPIRWAWFVFPHAWLALSAAITAHRYLIQPSWRVQERNATM